jgi:hypothetical protein
MNKGNNEERKTMRELIIDEEFKMLLPALDEQTYALLEESLTENGCIHPLVVWNQILIDGHNRYEICQKHEIPFGTVEKEFASREAALIWIIATQVARRNLNPMQLSYYRGLHYRADKQIVKNEAGRNQYEQMYEVSRHSDDQPKNQKTVQRLAEQYNVSPKTIERDSRVAEAIDAIGESSPEAKREILSGAADISKKQLRELAAEATQDEIKAVAESISDGTFGRRKPAEPKEAQDAMAAFSAAISKMADEFGAAVKRLANDVDAGELRAALRGHIEKLEDLYRQI